MRIQNTEHRIQTMKWFIINNSVLYLLISVFLLSFYSFAADVELEASSQGVVKIKIGLLAFAPENVKEKHSPAIMPDTVIESDLTISNRFEVIRSAKYDSSVFSSRGAPMYASGSYFYKDDQITIACSLRDARTKELLMDKKYKGDEKSLRLMAHRFSDEIVNLLFGEKGIAQTKIVFVNKSATAKEIYIMDYDGYNAAPVTNNRSINLFPSWSPQKDEIVYTSYAKGNPDLYITSIFTGKTRVLFQNRSLNSSPEWSKIENKIAFASSISGNTEVYVMEADGGKPQKLTCHWGIDTSPTWSPNGYEIAFVSDRCGKPQIYIMDQEGANVRRLTFQGDYNDAPAWSPKGDKIAYASLDTTNFNIYTISADGRDINKLTDGPEDDENPAWSPDGRLIAFARALHGKSDIFIMNEDGTGQRRITFTGTCSMPGWSGF